MSVRSRRPNFDTDSNTSVTSIAPPATQKRRTKVGFKNLIHEHKTTIFDSPEFRKDIMYGFYVLFWVLLGVNTLRALAVNLIYTGRLLEDNVVGLLRRDLFKVAFTDFCMYLCMYVTYFLQYLVKKDRLNWQKWGWKLQHLWQAVFLISFIAVARLGDFPWIARIFLLLHSLTMLMKQHSYAMYNGHLKSIVRELEVCEELRAHRTGKGEVTDEIIERLEFCREELDLQSKNIAYPSNLTLHNFFMFTMFPTLVYQLEFPRTPRIRWWFVLKKATATLSLFVILIIWSEQHILPIAMSLMNLRNTPLSTRMREYPLILSDLVVPFFVAYLITFYLIWDAILNTLAELTCFGGRQFYRDWWNTVQWDQFARDWNVPVYQFLYRHVYHSSISTLHVTKTQGMFITFMLSSVFHELAMYVIFGRLRGYLFAFQLLQLPLELLSRQKFFRTYPSMGIALFWFGIFVGPSILTSLYLTF